MTIEFIPFGKPYTNLSPDNLKWNVSKKILQLCTDSKDFEIIELRYLDQDETISDIIVVDCLSDEIKTKNQYGIKKRERLALVFTAEKIPQVRALRKNFPTDCLHLNDTPSGEPASLCLYYEPWNAVEISWTAQKHLGQILWWLSETAKGKLHRDDQPLERVYFDSPYEIVLPPDFEEKSKDKTKSLILIIIQAVE